MPNILITGGTGFIGRRLLKALKSDPRNRTICLLRSATFEHAQTIPFCDQCVNDTGTHQDLLRVLREAKIDVVIHLASLFLASHNENHIDDLVDSNIRFPLRLLEAMKAAGVRKFLNTGTIFQHSETAGYEPFNLYAATKQAFQDLADHYCRNDGFSCLTLKLGDTFGIGDTRKKIVQILVDAALHDQKIDLSPGEQRISLTWVDDIVQGFCVGVDRLLAGPNGGHEVFGLCNPDLLAIRDVGDLVLEISEGRPDFCWGGRGYRPNEIMSPHIPPQLPGWAVSTSVSEGLKRLIAYTRNRGRQGDPGIDGSA